MKHINRTYSALAPTLFVVLWALLIQIASGQTYGVARPNAAYRPSDALDPATLMSQENFRDTANRGYATVEGYINYVAGTISTDGTKTRIRTQADGDFHFEMQTTNAPRPKGISPAGLVCEINPAWQLKNWNALSQISRQNKSTYRKVRVYGRVRFGTESGHSGTRIYQIGNGKTLNGHWEIHPVERIEAIDGRGPLDIGPSARITSWPIKARYKVTNANFSKPGPSNFAKLIGSVQRILSSPDGSGDVDVLLKIGATTYLATIPQYYIKAFDRNTQTLVLHPLKNFAAINHSLKPGNSKRTFYGLRSWKFGEAGAFAALQPVEMIK